MTNRSIPHRPQSLPPTFPVTSRFHGGKTRRLSYERIFQVLPPFHQCLQNVCLSRSAATTETDGSPTEPSQESKADDRHGLNQDRQSFCLSISNDAVLYCHPKKRPGHDGGDSNDWPETELHFEDPTNLSKYDQVVYQSTRKKQGFQRHQNHK